MSAGFIPNTAVHITSAGSGDCTQVSDTDQPGPSKTWKNIPINQKIREIIKTKLMPCGKCKPYDKRNKEFIFHF